MTEPDPPPPLDVRRRENPVTQGARYGATGCVGCLVFVALGLFVLIVLASIAHH